MAKRRIPVMLLVRKRKYSLWVRNCHYHAYRRFNEDQAAGGDINVTPFGGETNDPLYTDLPEPRQSKSERKPYPTPMKTLIRRAKEEKELRKYKPCQVLEHPPDNGLLVPELVPVSHQVYWARQSLIIGISKLLPSINVLKCRSATVQFGASFFLLYFRTNLTSRFDMLLVFVFISSLCEFFLLICEYLNLYLF